MLRRVAALLAPLLISSIWLLMAGACAPNASSGRCLVSNCSGCCADDVCVRFEEQSSDRCGVGGAQCGGCLADRICQQGQCVEPSEVEEVPRDLGCGEPGEPCCLGVPECEPGLICDDLGFCGFSPGPPDGGGVEQPDAGTTSSVGGPCTTAEQCAGGLCLNIADGYCSSPCDGERDCPAGSICGADPSGAAGRVCLASCTQPGRVAEECRAGQVCDRAAPGAQPACIPGCGGAIACAGGAKCDARGFCCGKVGLACCEGKTCDDGLSCGADGYCRNRPIGSACTAGAQCEALLCIRQPPGGTTACPNGPCWQGGYCSGRCNAPEDCGPKGVCTAHLRYENSQLCLSACTYNGGRGGCRTGYVCDRHRVHGTQQYAFACTDACNAPADCQAAAVDCVNGFCCGRTGFACCGGVGGTCPFGGRCVSGYCE